MKNIAATIISITIILLITLGIPYVLTVWITNTRNLFDWHWTAKTVFAIWTFYVILRLIMLF